MKDPVLSQALAALDAADLAATDDTGCVSLLSSIKRVQGWLSSTEARVTSRMRELHATKGDPLEAGRTIRHANRSQRRALRATYRTCAFGNCDMAFERCEIHHILPWQLGGMTDLANLIPVCSRHHHVVHDQGLILDREPDRTLIVKRPDGEVLFASEPDLSPQRSERPKRRRVAA